MRLFISYGNLSPRAASANAKTRLNNVANAPSGAILALWSIVHVPQGEHSGRRKMIHYHF